MKLQGRLENLLEHARLKRMSYRRFFEAFLCTYGEYDTKHEYIHSDEEIVRKIKELADIISSARDNLVVFKHHVKKIKNSGFKPFLIDCLGLPEIYKIYLEIAEKHGGLKITILPYINEKAFTYAFTKSFGGSRMLEIAKELGTSLYKEIDKTIHRDFGNPMDPQTLIHLAEAKLETFVFSLVRDVIKHRKVFIFADHGYDAYCRYENQTIKCYLGHGKGAKLAKLAPLIVVNTEMK